SIMEYYAIGVSSGQTNFTPISMISLSNSNLTLFYLPTLTKVSFCPSWMIRNSNFIRNYLSRNGWRKLKRYQQISVNQQIRNIGRGVGKIKFISTHSNS